MKRWVKVKGNPGGRRWEVVGEEKDVWIVRHYEHGTNIETFVELPKEGYTLYTDVPLTKED